MKKCIPLFIFILFGSSCQTPQPAPKQTFSPEYPFLDYRLPLEDRVNDLVSRLTLEEKVGQMMYTAPAVERLGVPAYNWWNECLHGVARNGRATVFPQAIGMAATFDDSLISAISSAIGDEARAKFRISTGIGNRGQYAGLTFWTPNVNIFRDPRWGRGQETYGEDPYLSATMGSAFVKGLQGADDRYLKAAGCAKHFVVHSGPERLRHEFNAVASPKDMNETYFPAFKALANAGVEGFMCAYNRTNGEPCCASPELLTDVLREEWGFKGYITSDCWALRDIFEGHKTAPTAVEAAAEAFNSGVNLNCGNVFDPYLRDAVKQGLVKETDIDSSLRILLKTRFKLGLFDPEGMNPYDSIPDSVINSKSHRALARKAACESMVMLKNDGVLPLNDSIRSLYVVGPNAADIEPLLGNYYGVSGEMVTFLEGLVAKASAGTTVEYKQGFLLDSEKPNPIDWSTGGAADADATVIVAGISGLIEGEEGEAIASHHYGDRFDYGLPDNQVEYIKKISKVGDKPLILVLTAGSPLDVAEVAPLVDAVIYAWYPGEQGGNALADVLFGDYNPSGRLPITFPESFDQLPPYDNYSMENRTYRYMNGEPAYPFGFGMSYTTFDYESVVVGNPDITSGDKVLVTVKLKNTGKRDGNEVVQLYLTYPDAVKKAPHSSLIAFRKVDINAGEEKVLEIELASDDFRIYDEAGNAILLPGKYTLVAGGASPMKRSEELGKKFVKTDVSVQ
ncbi:MAG TPA: glycoside hydrolase family 3 C-terminal domain-containing protein [Bacteroidales bacterium]|nr:glycoside hydrolase family 3 C-terminal domain-containing protein [Bacteroidales bacterium]